MSDEQVLALRDQMYELAGAVVHAWRRTRAGAGDAEALAAMTPDERGDVEERAAMLEFDGKMSRREATRTALAMRSDDRGTRL